MGRTSDDQTQDQRLTTPERYRSGRNGGASKASCRETGTWVRIPPSPPFLWPGTMPKPHSNPNLTDSHLLCAVTAVATLLVVAVAIDVPVRAAGQQDEGRTVWGSIYSEDQAARGKLVYEASCSACHLADLSGSAQGRALAGEPFKQDWYEDTVGNLYSRLRRLMPFDEPGTLTDQAYLDTLAYILQVNEFPGGSADLGPDGLELIQIEGPDGPGPVPSFAMVRVVGCMTTGSGNWSLTQATEPARTSEPAASSPEELSALESAAPGRHTFELLNIYPSPDDHEGHRMEVKGLLIRLPDRSRINVSSVAMVAPSCAP